MMAAIMKVGSPRNELISSDGEDRDSILSGSISFTSDLQNRLKDVENEKLNLMINHNNLIKEFNKRMESHLEEIRVLKSSNQNLQSEMQELRDLCCYLDDDRQKCRKLAKEWQRFGKYTVTVMRNEVMSYQEKLGNLEGRQLELVKENGELRDICVYLDNQRAHQTTIDEDEVKKSIFKYVVCEKCKILKSPKTDDWNSAIIDSTSPRHENGISTYTHQLEDRVKQLEEDKAKLNAVISNRKAKKRVSFLFPEDDGDSSTSEQDRYDMFQNGHNRHDSNVQGILRNGFRIHEKEIPHPPFAPETMANADSETQAMKVMEIQEKLERASIDSGSTETLSENESAILKEMCNVVWKKLRDSKSPSPPPYKPPTSNNNAIAKANSADDLKKNVLEDLC